MIYNENMQQKIIQSIQDEIPSKDAMKNIQVSESYFRKILKENKLQWIPSRHRIYKLNHGYFNSIDNEEKAYWLGFLYADGHVSDDGALHLQLQGRDIKVLEDLKKSLDYTGNIKLRKIKGKDYYGLRIWSVEICSALKKLGINRDKTKNPSIPKIRKELYKDFIRGLIDGDGTIYCKRKSDKKMISTIHILIHEKCLNDILDMMESFIEKFTCSVGDHHRTKYLKIISINGNRQSLKILNAIYLNSNLYLERKYKKYLELLKYYCDNPNLLERSERIQRQSHRNQGI